MHDHRVKLHNKYSRKGFRGERITTMAEHGHTIDEMAAKIPESPQDGRLVVEYILGRRDVQDIAHLLTPYKPTSVVFLGPVKEGYLCEAKGDYPESSFQVLFELPGVSAESLKRALDEHGEEIAFIAYKNAHERNPAGYLDESSGSTQVLAAPRVSRQDLEHIFPYG